MLSITVALRIVNGSDSAQGFIEVYDGNAFRPVCSSGFTMESAKIICKNLGYRDVTTFYGQQINTMGTSNINCVGNDSAITECDRKSWRLANCSLNEAVYIVCEVEQGKM